MLQNRSTTARYEKQEEERRYRDALTRVRDLNAQLSSLGEKPVEISPNASYEELHNAYSRGLQRLQGTASEQKKMKELSTIVDFYNTKRDSILNRMNELKTMHPEEIENVGSPAYQEYQLYKRQLDHYTNTFNEQASKLSEGTIFEPMFKREKESDFGDLGRQTPPPSREELLGFARPAEREDLENMKQIPSSVANVLSQRLQKTADLTNWMQKYQTDEYKITDEGVEKFNKLPGSLELFVAGRKYKQITGQPYTEEPREDIPESLRVLGEFLRSVREKKEEQATPAYSPLLPGMSGRY